MSTVTSSHRATIRTIVVVALAAFVLIMCLPDIRRLWQPTGEFQLTTNQDYVVNFIRPTSNAAKAGLRIGDRYDVTTTPPQYRYCLLIDTTYLPEQPVTVGIVRDGQKNRIVLLSDRESMEPAKKALIIGRELVMLLFVGVGASLVLLRPSASTWAFYLFCLGANGSPASVLASWLALPWNWLVGTLYAALGIAGIISVAVFAAVFLHEQDKGWRGTVLRFAPLAWLILFALQMYNSWGDGWFGWRTRTTVNVEVFLLSVVSAISLYAFVSTYVSAQGAERQRIRWVVFGFGTYLVAFAANNVVNNYFPAWPYWVHATLNLMYVFVPLAIGYAVIRHRVIDVSFVVSRTLVYAVLTTLLVGIFSLVDWFFTDYLSNARLGTVAEVGAVLAFGIWFNGLHRRVETLIDATFFRQRHRAEVQLARIASALPRAPTADTVAQFLVDEPVRALSLASAALFRRNLDSQFIREAAVGWTPSELLGLDSKDNALLTLAETEEGPLSLYDHPWRKECMPAGAARPVLALPIIVRRELAAIVFYGSHLHGEALDPDEIKALAGLAPGAAAAYDHLEAEAMRRKNELLERKVETMQALLAEAQIQPT